MPKAKAAGTLLEEVRANLPTVRRRRWVDTVPAETLTELEAIRDDWRAGRLGPGVTKTGLGKAICATLVARGIPCHALTVVRWLEP